MLTDDEPRVHWNGAAHMPVPPLLAAIGTAAWRLLVAAIALWGYLLYFDGNGFEGLVFLTQSGNLLVGLGYGAVALVGLGCHLIRRTELDTAPVRGAMTLLMVVVGSTYVGVMSGDTSEAKDLLTHVITPTLAMIDWCFVGKAQNRTRWWHPLTWLIVPALYLAWYTASDGFSARSSWGSPIYSFMDPGDGSYVGVIAGLVAASAAFAYLLYGIAKIKGLLSRTIAESTGDTGDAVDSAPGGPSAGTVSGPAPPGWRPQGPAQPAHPPYAHPPYAQQPYAQSPYPPQPHPPRPSAQQSPDQPPRPPAPRPHQPPQPDQPHPQQQPPRPPPQQQPPQSWPPRQPPP